MSIYSILVCTEPYKFEATDSMLKVCEALIKKGHNVRGIFFFGTGVYNLKKDISTGTSIRNIPEKIEKFCTQNNIPSVACSTWVSLTGLKEENFIKGATEEGLGDFSNWAIKSDKLLIFGAGG